MALDILISSDHGGVNLKSILVSHLKTNGFNVRDLGPYEASSSVDYPDYAEKLANEMQQYNFKGILICGSGIGMSIAINRYEWVRGALVHDETTARLCREHNDANVIILGERILGELTAISCVNIFLNTSFLGGRHQKRVNKLRNSKMLMSPQENKNASG